jgi:disulfide bond formation protein DsbB
MKANMGSVDRVVRISIAVIIGVLLIIGKVSGVTAIVLGVIALVLFVTGIIARCLLYYPIGVSTCKCAPVEEKAAPKESDTTVEARL